MLRLSGGKIFAFIVVLAVVAVVAYGIVVVGSPTLERQRQFDDRRVNHLQQIENAIGLYDGVHHALPPNLQAISGQAQTFVESINDPVTNVPYTYLPGQGASYQLCATFSLDSSAEPANEYARPVPIGSWQHPAGNYCFALNGEASTGLLPAFPLVPKMGCRLMRAKTDKSMHCVACIPNGTCRDAAADWEFFTPTSTSGTIGIPYGCTVTERGCELVQ